MENLTLEQKYLLAKMYEVLFGINRDYVRGEFIVTPRQVKPRMDPDLLALEKAGYITLFKDKQGEHPDHWELTELGYDLGKVLQWELIYERPR